MSARRADIDADIDAALGAFDREHAGLALSPVVVVIPAFEEEANIGAVVAAVPSRVCDLPVSTVVVVDGGADDTAAVARRHGALTVELPRNRGQGVALRTGYRLAARGGARYLVTIDADGQLDPGEIPTVLEPVCAGTADLVIGSRRLGDARGGTAVRSAGVRAYSWLVRALTGVPVTDSSNGFRAFTVEVARTVSLEQVQYQTAELLISAICNGFRVQERPVTVHPRASGTSKKGHALRYGYRYGRVVLATWRRDRSLRGRAVRRAPRAVDG